MRATCLRFSIERLSETDGYVIVAEWPDGGTEQLVGVFVSEEFALLVAKRFASNPPFLPAPAPVVRGSCAQDSE